MLSKEDMDCLSAHIEKLDDCTLKSATENLRSQADDNLSLAKLDLRPLCKYMVYSYECSRRKIEI